jgi:hypothetical protein
MTSGDEDADDSMLVRAFEEAERRFKEFHSPEEMMRRVREQQDAGSSAPTAKKPKRIQITLPDEDDDEEEDDGEEEGELMEDEEQEHEQREEEDATEQWKRYFEQVGAYYSAMPQQYQHRHCCHCCTHGRPVQATPAAAQQPPPAPPQLDSIDPQLAVLLKTWFDSGYQLGIFAERQRQQQR